MRSLPILLALLLVAPLGAAQVYRWVDREGVVHYSDRPIPGAEPITVQPAPKPGSVAPTPAVPSPVPTFEPPRPFQGYTSCSIRAPAPDTTFGIGDAVAVSLDLQPALQDEDVIRATLNGAAIAD